MVSNSKLYAKLDGLEAELAQRLVPHLNDAAAGLNEWVFCVTGYHDHARAACRPDPTTSALVTISAEILSLKQKLGESSAGSIAERICWYCREWGKVKQPSRAHVQALAEAFLSEIENI